MGNSDEACSRVRIVSRRWSALGGGDRSWGAELAGHKDCAGGGPPRHLVSVSTLAWYCDRLGDIRRAAEMGKICWNMRDRFHISRVSLPVLLNTDGYGMHSRESVTAQVDFLGDNGFR